jgi:hypothetical protein
MCKNNVGIKKMNNAINRLIRFDKIMDRGITSCGNLAFFIKLRSKTKEGVVFVKESVKKFHTNKPLNK